MDELLGRRVPHSAPAEQAVIGSMLIDPRSIPEVMEKLKGEEFYIKLNRDIYGIPPRSRMVRGSTRRARRQNFPPRVTNSCSTQGR